MPQLARDVSCVILSRILIIHLTFSSLSPSSASCSSSSSSSKPWKSPFDSYEIPAAFNLASNFLILCSFWYTLAKSALVVASLLSGAEVLKDGRDRGMAREWALVPNGEALDGALTKVLLTLLRLFRHPICICEQFLFLHNFGIVEHCDHSVSFLPCIWEEGRREKRASGVKGGSEWKKIENEDEKLTLHRPDSIYVFWVDQKRWESEEEDWRS